MAHPYVVLASINGAGNDRCVDIFRRRDGTFGFEKFRRDVEDARGWFPIGGHSARVFANEAAARAEALHSVEWLG